MSDPTIPSALREALDANETYTAFDGTLQQGLPLNSTRADRARAMAAALRWAVPKHGYGLPLTTVEEAIAALEQEANKMTKAERTERTP